MLYFDGLFGLVMFGLWLYCLIDVITTDSARCRNLPKLAWLFIVLLLPDIGSIAWLVAGHPWPTSAGSNCPTGATPAATRSTSVPAAGRPPTRTMTRSSCAGCASGPSSSAGSTRPGGRGSWPRSRNGSGWNGSAGSSPTRTATEAGHIR